MTAAADGQGGRIARWAAVSSRIQRMLEPRYDVYIQQKSMRTKKIYTGAWICRILMIETQIQAYSKDLARVAFAFIERTRTTGWKSVVLKDLL